MPHTHTHTHTTFSNINYYIAHTEDAVTFKNDGLLKKCVKSGLFVIVWNIY